MQVPAIPVPMFQAFAKIFQFEALELKKEFFLNI